MENEKHKSLARYVYKNRTNIDTNRISHFPVVYKNDKNTDTMR